jgi:hypothetical protein
MTDDDLQNSKCTKESSKCHAAFNINRKMKGNEFKVDLGFKYAFLQSNDNQLSFIAGGRYAMYTYSPSDMRQIEYIKSRGIEITLYQKSLDAFQETAPKYYGLVLGLEYEKLLPTQTFAIAVKGFLPLDFRSKQDWSSYEWSVEQQSIFSNAFGFDVKMSTALKVSDTNWINFYTSLNYFIAKNLAEYNKRDGFSKSVSKVKYLKHVRLSAGVSFLFKSN